MKVKELKVGQYFTIKPIAEPKESQVFVLGCYCQGDKKYNCNRFDDINTRRSFPGDKEVYTDFVF